MTALQRIGRVGLPRHGDLVLAAALALVGLLDLWLLRSTPEVDRLGGTPFVLLGTGALAVRRSRPLTCALVTAGAIAAQGVLVAPATAPAQVAAALISCFSLGAHAGRWRALAGFAAMVAAIASLSIAAGEATSAVAIPIFAGVPLVGGLLLRWARGHASRLEELTAQLEHERERTAVLAVAAERVAIARELHDVVSHGVGAMAVQAAGARRILDHDPERAREALATIESTGREAMAELQRLVTLLRGPDPATTSTPPGLDQLAALAERLRGSGFEVRFTEVGERPAVTAAEALTVVRVLQEALTNAVTHAPGGRVDATVAYDAAQVSIAVRNTAGTAPAVPGTGHGLIGLRERVGMFGGTLTHGPTRGGGYAVEAVLPIGAAR